MPDEKQIRVEWGGWADPEPMFAEELQLEAEQPRRALRGVVVAAALAGASLAGAGVFAAGRSRGWW